MLCLELYPSESVGSKGLCERLQEIQFSDCSYHDELVGWRKGHGVRRVFLQLPKKNTEEDSVKASKRAGRCFNVRKLICTFSLPPRALSLSQGIPPSLVTFCHSLQILIRKWAVLIYDTSGNMWKMMGGAWAKQGFNASKYILIMGFHESMQYQLLLVLNHRTSGHSSLA